METTTEKYYPLVVYCPACGSESVEREERAMEGVYHYNRHYCQDCGCPFKVLQKWQTEKVAIPEKEEVE